MTSEIRLLRLACERIADALDRAIPKPPELTAEEQRELAEWDHQAERHAISTLDEEFAAVIELLEAKGQHVPDETYRRLGMEPPNRKLETEPSPETLIAPQPGTIVQPAELLQPPEPLSPFSPSPDDPPVTYRKSGL